ncbi:MAG TPA: hypothetical protein VLG09_04180 [Candidatus Saccharimonadales bacterium]|nr:hypothetical protein [Candidatus Saccharimonadales bacterium]
MSKRFSARNFVRMGIVVCGAIGAVYGAALWSNDPSGGLKVWATILMLAGFGFAIYGVVTKD